MVFQSTNLENWRGTSFWELLMFNIQDCAVKSKKSNRTAKSLELRGLEGPWVSSFQQDSGIRSVIFPNRGVNTFCIWRHY